MIDYGYLSDISWEIMVILYLINSPMGFDGD